jgi:hypothetical protein
MYSLVWCVLYKFATIVYGKFLSLNKIDPSFLVLQCEAEQVVYFSKLHFWLHRDLFWIHVWNS